MEIEEVKTWQWMLAGLIAGFFFSCIVVWRGPTYDRQNRDAIATGEFEGAVYPFATRKKLAQDDQERGIGAVRGRIAEIEAYQLDKQPLLRNLVVHLPQTGDSQHRYCVTGEYVTIGRRPRDSSKPNGPRETYEEWKPFEYPAATPYVPGYSDHIEKQMKNHPNSHAALDIDCADLKKSLGGRDSFPTVVDFLKAVSAMPNSNLPRFTQAWWEDRRVIWTMPALAGFLMIGVAWPLAFTVLQNIGMAKPPTVKAKPKPMSEPEPMNILSTAGVSTAGVVAKSATPPPLPPVPSEGRKYGGEFYPVVKAVTGDEKPAAKAKAK
jgi:hypothetical protein